MGIPKPDLREFDRIEGNKIPKSMQTILIGYGNNEDKKSTVVDYSPKGMRLLVDGKKCKVLPHEILFLKPAQEQFTLVGRVIHIIPAGDEKYYLGILFLPTRSLETYKNMIDDNY